MIGATFRRLLRHDGGATAIEYGLIAGLILLAIVSGVGGFTEVLSQLWNENATTISENLQ